MNEHARPASAAMRCWCFARRTRRVLRRPTAWGRYGGEEFLVLLPGPTRRPPWAWPTHPRHAGHGPPAGLRVSIRLTSWSGLTDPGRHALPPTPLYRAREEGRNHWRWAEASSGTATRTVCVATGRFKTRHLAQHGWADCNSQASAAPDPSQAQARGPAEARPASAPASGWPRSPERWANRNAAAPAARCD